MAARFDALSSALDSAPPESLTLRTDLTSSSLAIVDSLLDKFPSDEMEPRWRESRHELHELEQMLAERSDLADRIRTKLTEAATIDSLTGETVEDALWDLVTGATELIEEIDAFVERYGGTWEAEKLSSAKTGLDLLRDEFVRSELDLIISVIATNAEGGLVVCNGNLELWKLGIGIESLGGQSALSGVMEYVEAVKKERRKAKNVKSHETMKRKVQGLKNCHDEFAEACDLAREVYLAAEHLNDLALNPTGTRGSYLAEVNESVDRFNRALRRYELHED